MGTPTKLGNESVIAISGSSEFNIAFPTFINFIQSGVATGTTYVSRAKAPLEYSQNLITSLNSALGAGSWELGYFVYKGTTSKVTLTGSSGLFGEIYASRIEVSFTNAAPGGIKTIRFDGRFVIDPYDFRLGSGDSVTKIFIDREPNSSNVIGSEVLDVSLSFGSDGIWSGNLLQHIRSTKKASGDYSGYAYQSTTTFSGVNINGVSVDQKTTFSDEKVTSNSYKAYGADGKLFYSSIPSSIKAINLETDIGFAQEVALSGNTLISLSGSHTSSVSTYAGDDWVIDNSTGSNVVDGGPGTDAVEYLGISSGFQVQRLDSDTVLVSRGLEENTLRNIELIVFSDKTITSANVGYRQSVQSDFRDVSALQDKDGHYLFTANATEAQIMQQYGWSLATGLRAFESLDYLSGVTLHKFYYPPTNSFYYATDDQAKAVKAAFTGWDYYGATDLKVYTQSQVGSGVSPKEAVPIFQMWVNGKGHVYTTDVNLVDSLMGQDINTDLLTANNVTTSKGTYNGVVFWGDPIGTNKSGVLPAASISATDFRDVSALQDKDGHYLFTANATEAQIMQQYGWSVATGLKAFESADNANGITLHKFYYQPTNSFYYATDDQAKAVKAAFTGWDYQGATDLKVYTNAQYSSGSTPKGSVPIYQMWVNGKGHVYTSDTALVDRLMGQDINTDILTANNVVTAVGTYNGVVFWGDPIG